MLQAAFLSLVFGGYTLLAQGSLSAASMAPVICGFGLGYMLPGRV